MKAIHIISAALALTPLSWATETPTPAPSAPVEQNKNELHFLSMIDGMEKLVSLLGMVDDKASADAAARLIAPLRAEMEEARLSIINIEEELIEKHYAKMEAANEKLAPLVEKLSKAEYYGSTALKSAMSEVPQETTTSSAAGEAIMLEMVELVESGAPILESVVDKASADKAALALALINEKMASLSQKASSCNQEDVLKYLPRLTAVQERLKPTVERIRSAEFYDSAGLKAAFDSN